MNRNEIAAELMRDCPAESRKDHRAIAAALRGGAPAAEILAMDETTTWPETAVWLKYELDEELEEDGDN